MPSPGMCKKIAKFCTVSARMNACKIANDNFYARFSIRLWIPRSAGFRDGFSCIPRAPDADFNTELDCNACQCKANDKAKGKAAKSSKLLQLQSFYKLYVPCMLEPFPNQDLDIYVQILVGKWSSNVLRPEGILKYNQTLLWQAFFRHLLLNFIWKISHLNCLERVCIHTTCHRYQNF